MSGVVMARLNIPPFACAGEVTVTELSLTKERVRNYNVAVKEWNGEIIFLRRIVEGGTNRSYGIQVARLAGLPQKVIDRAREILSNLEKGELDSMGMPKIATTKIPSSKPKPPLQPSLFAQPEWNQNRSW